MTGTSKPTAKRPVREKPEAKPLPESITPQLSPQDFGIAMQAFDLATKSVGIRGSAPLAVVWSKFEQAHIVYGVAHGLCDSTGKAIERESKP